MPCPYAERKGPAVYCRLIGRKVNPLAFPCLTDKYEKCRYYRRHAAEAKREEKPSAAQAAPRREAIQAPPRPVAAPSPAPGGRRGEVKGLTLDGRKPRTCLECIYYGTKTRTCLLLGIPVDNPEDPPCARV